MATVETAKESERGIVDIETLKYTNQSLISTLDEVLQIQTDGAKKMCIRDSKIRGAGGCATGRLSTTAKNSTGPAPMLSLIHI